MKSSRLIPICRSSVVAVLLCTCAAGCYMGETFSDPVPIPAGYVPPNYSAATSSPRIVTGLPTTMTVAATTQAAMDGAARDQVVQATQSALTKRFGVDSTPQLNDYLILVGSLLGINTPRPEVEFAYLVLDTDQPIHGALAPKTIVLSRGLIRQMEDESELAGVIGREISNLLAGRTLKAAGLPTEPTTRLATTTATTLPALPPATLNKHVAKLTDVLLKDGLGPEAEQAADVEGARFAAAARYAPDGFLRLLTRQKPATTTVSTTASAAWERIKALNANVEIIAKAYPAADVRLPVRFEEYARSKKPGTANNQ